MSWSVNLSGPKEVLKREISDAMLLFDRALDWVENAELETLSVNLNGYVSWNQEGEITSSSVGFNVSESTPPPNLSA